MSNKIGRNDPCPCGSGKKYKKCCGHEASSLIKTLIPEDELTGTPLDAYTALLPLFFYLEQKIIQFEPDGRELKKAIQSYEKRFRPGLAGGLLDSHSVSWELFDLRFGPSRRTIAERVLEDPSIRAGLDDFGLALAGHLAASYATFYQVLEDGPEVVLLEELGTGRRWHVHYFRELFPEPAGKGEIWYTRLIGPPERALSYTTPYVYPADSRSQFKRGVDGLYENFLKDSLSIGVPAERLFAEAQKASALFWTEYIHFSNNATPEMIASLKNKEPKPILPHIVNTDKDEIVFTTMHFRVKDEKTIRCRLAKLKSFDYDEREDTWTWFKPASRLFPDEPRTSRGHFKFEDGRLVAETNSRERAAWLEDKLKRHFPGQIVLEKTLYRKLDDLPPLTPEERERNRAESEEFRARPEVQEALRKQKEFHYFEKWPRIKIPALGNKTPLQAAKTAVGRKKLEDLLDYFERRQDLEPDQPRVDFGKLRHKLGLPAGSN